MSTRPVPPSLLPNCRIGDPTPADGILDRLVHNAQRIEMCGESMRKRRNPPLNEKKE